MIAAAAAASDYVQPGLLGLLVTLAGFFIRGMLQDRGAGFDMAKANEARIEQLEKRVAVLQADNDEQHRMKHAANNALTRALSAVDMAHLVSMQAMSTLDRCDCDELEVVKTSLSPIIAILERLRVDAGAD